ncbi:MAG: flavin reductase family protein [Verrucomicrobiota bacterium]
MEYSQADLKAESRVRRLNLINSVTGIKPANLIGTIASNGTPNLAIFSSILHLGSNPALIGFILRPHGEFRRDTYLNLQQNGSCTVNSVQAEFAENAHYTSAKFESSISEFGEVGLTEEYRKDCPAPFVAESRLKYSLKLEQTIPIELNGTTLVIGSIQDLYVEDQAVSPDGYIDFQELNLVGVGGLNSYYSLSKVLELPYARVNALPDFANRAAKTTTQAIS